MGFAQKPKALFVKKCIQNAMNNAVAHKNMDPRRLVVTYCYATKGRYLKRIRYHAKGRRGIMFRYYSHLRVGVTEQPYDPFEVRVGRAGRKTVTIERALKRLHELQQEKENEEAPKDVAV